MADISKITLPSNNTYDIKDANARSKIVFYGTCTTASNVAAKVATIENSNDFALVSGVTVNIKFTNLNTATSPTLNVNSTGAKYITQGGLIDEQYISEPNWDPNSIVSFTYDGSRWFITNSLPLPIEDTGSGIAVWRDLSSPTTYTISHSNSVTAQTTQAVYPIKIDAQGHISAYGSAVTSMPPTAHTHSVDSLTAGYENIHPENTPIIIPFMHNDIAHLLKRGGSASVTKDGNTWSVDINNCFDGSGSYWSINPTGITTIVIELTLHKVFAWSNTIYVDFGAAGWRSKSVKIEVMNTNYSSDTWSQKYITTTNSLGHVYIRMSHTPVGASDAGGGFNKIRLTFSAWQTATNFRISQIGVYNYGSTGLRETYMSRGVDDYVFRNITPNANNTYSLGSSSNKWSNLYTNTINGVTVPSITAQTTQAVYPIKIDAQGHISAYGSAVTIPAAVAVKGNSETTYRTGNVNLTAANIGAAASSHAHGNITSAGDITSTVAIASGDRLVINDESASKINNSSITFGTSTSTFLANNGTWQTPYSGTSVYSGTSTSGTLFSNLFFEEVQSGSPDFALRLKMDKLWENANPTASTFASQTISLDLSTYSHVYVVYLVSPNDTSNMVECLAPIGLSRKFKLSGDGNRFRYRAFSATSTGVTFDVGQAYETYASTAASANGYNIPYLIYGIK